MIFLVFTIHLWSWSYYMHVILFFICSSVLVLSALIMRFVWLHCPVREDPFGSLFAPFIFVRPLFLFFLFFRLFHKYYPHRTNEWANVKIRFSFYVRSFVSFIVTAVDAPEASVHTGCDHYIFGFTLCTLCMRLYVVYGFDLKKLIKLYCYTTPFGGMFGMNDPRIGAEKGAMTAVAVASTVAVMVVTRKTCTRYTARHIA